MLDAIKSSLNAHFGRDNIQFVITSNVVTNLKYINQYRDHTKQRGCGPPIKLKYLISSDDYLSNFELCSEEDESS